MWRSGLHGASMTLWVMRWMTDFFGVNVARTAGRRDRRFLSWCHFLGKGLCHDLARSRMHVTMMGLVDDSHYVVKQIKLGFSSICTSPTITNLIKMNAISLKEACGGDN